MSGAGRAAAAPSGPVEIGGAGLAELTCARLLVGRGHRVRLPPPPGPDTAGERPLLLTGPALELLDSLWGPGLLDDAWEVSHRQVRWGGGHRPGSHSPPGSWTGPTWPSACGNGWRSTAWTHEGRIRRWVRPAGWWRPARTGHAAPSTGRDAAARGERPGSPAGPRVPSRALSSSPSAPERASGCRRLLAGTAPLRPGADERTAVLGTAETGWAHLTPLGRGAALVQAMVPGPAGDPVALLARLAAETGLGALLRHPPRSAAAIPAAPLLHPAPATPPAADAPGRLLVGAGAIRYDPLSGTGTAQALRTGILAAAVIDAAARGTAAPGALCAHYTARLRAAYADHQRSCVRLYGSAFPGPAWSDELDAARAASAAGWP